MPWFIKKDGDKFCVTKGTKESPGERVTCHPSRAKALAHMKALYANEPSAKEKSEAVVSMETDEMTALKALHDQLLAERPDGVSHNEEECFLCSADDEGEGMGDRLFTEEEVQAAVDRAVAEATSSLTDKIAELQQSQQVRALEEAVDKAKAEMQAELVELQAKLDAAVLEAQQAKEAKEALQTAWDAEKEAVEEAQKLAALKEERVGQLKELAFFPDDYVEENGDRFAAMSEDDFTARLDEWKALLDKSDALPKKTALTASREGTTTNGSMLSELRNLRKVLADPTVL